jgi:hypothetical protein
MTGVAGGDDLAPPPRCAASLRRVFHGRIIGH